MNIESELLAVLDNPAQIWEAMLANFPPHTRLAMTIFASCSTPITLVAWQNAISRVDPSSATRFEESLRTLDDNFIRIIRDKHQTHSATFRNPSIDDFCAGYLEKNSGLVNAVLAAAPDVEQIERLVQLATARHPDRPRERRYPNLASVVVDEPGAASDRLVSVAQSSGPLHKRVMIVGVLLDVMAVWNEQQRRSAQDATTQVHAALDAAAKAPHWPGLYAVLDTMSRARVIPAVLGPAYGDWYRTLTANARSFSQYDSLANLDIATGTPGADAAWAESFEHFAADALTKFDDIDEAQNARTYYEKVAEHLSLDMRADEWDETIEQLSDSDEEVDYDPDDWRDRGSAGSRGGRLDDLNRENGLIDGLFRNLTDE